MLSSAHLLLHGCSSAEVRTALRRRPAYAAPYLVQYTNRPVGH